MAQLRLRIFVSLGLSLSLICSIMLLDYMKISKSDKVSNKRMLRLTNAKQQSCSFDTRVGDITTRSLTRVFIMYLPSESFNHYIPELKWFYRSWIEMRKHQPRNWRTDILVLTDNTTNKEYLGLGCTETLRANATQMDSCIVHKVVLENNATKYLAEMLRLNKFINSIYSILEAKDIINSYDLALRTDSDTVVTPSMAIYIPENCTLLTGGGGYSTEFNTKRLKRVAAQLNMSNSGLSAIGSTWYGDAKVISDIAKTSIDAMLYLFENEFTPAEREGKAGTILWPDWHFGVLLLYGAHIAINDYASNKSNTVSIRKDLMDYYSTATDKVANHLHIHCWQTHDRFSKFEFKKDNPYRNMSLDNLDISVTRDYITYMAVHSANLTNLELKSLSNEVWNASKI